MQMQCLYGVKMMHVLTLLAGQHSIGFKETIHNITRAKISRHHSMYADWRYSNNILKVQQHFTLTVPCTVLF